MFVEVSCGAMTQGCTTVDSTVCTASIRCEEQGLTCGRGGVCVSLDATLLPDDGGTAPDDVPNGTDATLDGDAMLPPRQVVQIAAGADFTCALRAEGTVSCWGNNNAGQLGDPSRATHTDAVDVAGLTDAIQVRAGLNHACAIRRDRTVVCWGDNSSAQLGDGDSNQVVTPRPVVGVSDVAELSLGAYQSYARTNSGSVFAWGGYLDSSLGTGVPNVQGMSPPVLIPGVNDAVALGGHVFSTCLIRAMGDVQCWGRNYGGAIGTASGTPIASPTSIPGFTNPTKVIMGNLFGCALQGDGTVACWGKCLAGDMTRTGSLATVGQSATTGLRPRFLEPGIKTTSN
jgi:alpha-tubulin suppressor-like RCC1 family protein